MIVAARNPLRWVLTWWLLFALAACGGGGGGGDSSSGPPGGSGTGGGGGSSSARLTLSTSAVTVSAPVTSGARPTSPITVEVANAGDANYFIRVQFSNTGIVNLGSTRDRGVLEVLVNFKTPYDLRPGTYDDVLVFDLCVDGTCSSLVAGGSVTVPVQYNVLAPSPADGPSVALSVSSLNLQALITDAIAPGVPDLNVTFSGLQATPFVQVAWSGAALGHSFYIPSSPDGWSGGQLHAGVQGPSELGPGVYDGTVTITACLDSNCVNPIGGSPVTLSIHMSVADQVDGPNGYRMRIVDANVADMVWDATRQRLYLATPDPIPHGPNHQISVVDPASATVVSSTATAWTPGTMAISDDDQFLYVYSHSSPVAVQRLRTSDLSIDATIPLGVSSTGVAYLAREISVAPHQPQTIAVVRATNFDTPGNGGLVLFDNVTPRPSVLAERPEGAPSGPTMDRVTWGADASTLFAANVTGQSRQLFGLTADASGAHIARQVGAANLARGVHFGAGLVYTDDGTLYNPATLAVAGRLTPQPADAFADVTTIDASGNRAFLMWNRLDPANSNGAFTRYLTSFDLASRTEIATIPLHERWHPVKIIRWGTNGLALLVIRQFDSRVVLIDGAFVSP